MGESRSLSCTETTHRSPAITYNGMRNVFSTSLFGTATCRVTIASRRVERLKDAQVKSNTVTPWCQLHASRVCLTLLATLTIRYSRGIDLQELCCYNGGRIFRRRHACGDSLRNAPGSESQRWSCAWVLNLQAVSLQHPPPRR